MNYGRGVFWASGHDKGSDVPRSTFFDDYLKRRGKRHRHDKRVDLDQDVSYIWSWYVNIKNFSPDGRITHMSIETWQRIKNTDLLDWEIEAIEGLEIEWSKYR